jgi:hypothetical protein
VDPELRRRLKAVDPNLKIVSFRHKRKKAKTVNKDDWDKVQGDPCPKCGQPEVRFINGICRNCYLLRKEKLAKQEANLNPLIYNCKDKRLASRVQRYLAKLDRRG